MASFKRSYLEALGVEESKITAIMDAHMDVVNEITKERDTYKKEAEKIPALTKERDDALKAGRDSDGKDYKKLYEDLKASKATEEARAGKEAGYKSLLKSAKVPEKYWGLILKANSEDIDKLEMDGDKVKGSDDLLKAMQKDLAAYIPKTKTEGTDVENPPDHDDDDDGEDLGDLDMEGYIAARKKM